MPTHLLTSTQRHADALSRKYQSSPELKGHGKNEMIRRKRTLNNRRERQDWGFKADPDALERLRREERNIELMSIKERMNQNQQNTQQSIGIESNN